MSSSSISEPEPKKRKISPADGSPTSAGDPHQHQSSSASRSGTPIHSHYYTTEQYGISSFSRGHTVLATNVAPCILGPMPPDAFLDRFLPSHSISIPKLSEGTTSFQVGMFTSLLPPPNATGASGATQPTPYKALVCPKYFFWLLS